MRERRCRAIVDRKIVVWVNTFMRICLLKLLITTYYITDYTIDAHAILKQISSFHEKNVQ